jgi:beta-lactamase class D
LIGIETGKIIENEPVAYSGDPSAPDSLKKALNFNQAFKQSAVWYFREVIKNVGAEKMQKTLDSISYGSKKILGGLDSFWFNNTLTIKPDEQLGLMKRLYFNKLDKFFSQRTMNKVKEAMLMEKTDKYALSYKTGLTKGKNGKSLAWVVGWVVKDGNQNSAFPFVLNIEGDMSNEAMVETRMKLLKELLIAEKVLPQ